MSFPERLCYGARDLRRIYNRHLFAAMLVSVCFHMALIGLYVAGPGSAEAHLDATRRSDTLIVLPAPDGMIEQWTEVTEARRMYERRSDTLIVLPTPHGMIEQRTEVTEVPQMYERPTESAESAKEEQGPTYCPVMPWSYSGAEQDSSQMETQLHSVNPIDIGDSLSQRYFFPLIDGVPTDRQSTYPLFMP